METKQQTSVRLSAEAKRLLALVAQTLSISQAAALELAIRAMAKRERLK
jgi:predicted transcriptional regulator